MCQPLQSGEASDEMTARSDWSSPPGAMSNCVGLQSDAIDQPNSKLNVPRGDPVGRRARHPCSRKARRSRPSRS